MTPAAAFFLLLLVVPTVGTRGAHEDRERNLCNRQLPATGTWSDSPPFWQPTNCPTKHFTPEEVRVCMTGRTLYVIGNSVARQSAFNLIELLGGAYTTRSGQKESCPKHATSWGDSCHHEYNGVKVKYLFLQYMDGFDYSNRSGFPFVLQQRDGNATTDRYVHVNGSYINTPAEVLPDRQPPWAVDNCMHMETRACLQHFFQNATSQDVLMFTLGMPYRLLSAEEDAAAKSRVLAGGLDIDFTAWLTASAVAFKAHLAAIFPGHVFRVTLAQLHQDFAVYSPAMARVNELLWALWRPSSEPLPWHTIDQWAINAGRERIYNDAIHFNGNLSYATMFQMLTELCQ